MLAYATATFAIISFGSIRGIEKTLFFNITGISVQPIITASVPKEINFSTHSGAIKGTIAIAQDAGIPVIAFTNSIGTDEDGRFWYSYLCGTKRS